MVNLNDPRAQEFIEAVAACLVMQQETPGLEVEQKGESLVLELWSPRPVVVAASGQEAENDD